MNRVTRFIFPAILMSILGNVVVLSAYADNKPNADHMTKEVEITSSVDNRDFEWTSDRKLNWSDFLGNISEGFSDEVAAATYCSFGFEVEITPDNTPEIRVFNLFHVNKSWSKHKHHNQSILAHEQCHFDICELFTRRLRARLASCDVTIDDMNEKLSSIYEDVRSAYIAFQHEYESQTHHGLISKEQAKWEQLIKAALIATENVPEEIYSRK